MEFYVDFLLGCGRNLLITFLAALIPLTIGSLFSFLASLGKVPAAIFRWLSLPTEALCPILLVLSLFYLPGMVLHIPISTFWRDAVVIIGLAVCFIGYMPARYVPEVSFWKNLVCNGLDLLTQLFKWSPVARILAVCEIAMTAERAAARGNIFPLIVSVLIFAAILGVLEIGKRVCQTYMK